MVNGKLRNLKIVELNKYLDKNELSKKGKKTDKVNAITVDVLRKQQTEAIEIAIEESESENNSSDVNSDSEGDLIVEELENESDSDSDISVGAEESGQAEDDEPVPWVVTTRYGRHADHWNLFQLE